MLGRGQLLIALSAFSILAATAHGQTTTTAPAATTTAPAAPSSSVTSSGSTATRPGGNTGNNGSAFAAVNTFAGGSTTTATNTTGGGTLTNTVPTSLNPWRTTYGNVYGLGQSIMGQQTSSAGARTGAAAAKGFGQPLFTTATTSVSATNATTKIGYGYSNTNLNRTPRYTTVLGEDLPPIAHNPGVLQSSLQDTIARSTRIKNADQIRVAVNGDVVILSGSVGSQRERNLAESLIRLNPGVSAVANQLVIPGDPRP